MSRGGWRVLLTAGVLATMTACASGPTTPVTPAASAYRDLPPLTVPVALKASPQVMAQHEAAWRRLQSGDAGRASREFADLLRREPAFYPAEAALGYLAWRDRRYDEAARRFDAVIAADRTYLPALVGRMDVALLRREDMVALATSELILAVAPGRDEVRGQQDVLRLRVVQAQITRAAEARAAGRWDEAQAALDAALEVVPDSAVVLRELSLVEIARGRFDAAETHVRRSLALDAGDAESHAVMAAVLEAGGRWREAAEALAQALVIDPRPEWRERAVALSARADFEALPDEYRAIASSRVVTRGQLAAILGIRVQSDLARAPRRAAVVLTDVRSHWAAAWILPVTRAGWMEPFPNHTFQPSSLVRRADLAQVVWRVAQDVAAGQPADLARWRASRPVLQDVSRSHLAYAAIAGALACGAMQLDGGRFLPNRQVTGAEALASIDRLVQLAGQRSRP